MRHILQVPGQTCSCKGVPDSEGKLCPVCEWGARICTVCGAAEGELLDWPECLEHKKELYEVTVSKTGTVKVWAWNEHFAQVTAENEPDYAITWLDISSGDAEKVEEEP